MLLKIIFLTISIFATSHYYIVKPKDSLWNISKSKLNDPFKWSLIWKNNPDIKNPNLIFPGQKIFIPQEITTETKLQQPQPTITPQLTKQTIGEESVSEKMVERTTVEEVVSSPTLPVTEIIPIEKVRILKHRVEQQKEIQEQITPEPQKEVAKEQTKEQITTQQFVTPTPSLPIAEQKLKEYPNTILIKNEKIFSATVSGDTENKIMISLGDTIFLDTGSKDEIKPDMTGLIFQKKKRVYSPDFKFLGYEYRKTGVIKINSVDEDSSVATVTKCYEPIKKGDKVLIFR